MSLRFNLNDDVLVRVTPKGMETFRKHYTDNGLDPEPYFNMHRQWDGRLKFHLWEVMQMFGPAMIMGIGDMEIETELEFA